MSFEQGGGAILPGIGAFCAATQRDAALQLDGFEMVGKIVGAAVVMAGLALAGPAGAQGFSGGGAGGVAALRGATASPGYVSGFDGSDVGRPGLVETAPEPAARARGRVAPTDVDFAPRDGRTGAWESPF